MLLGDPEGGLGGAPAEAAEVGGQTVGARALAGSARWVFALLPCLPLKRNARSGGYALLVVSGGKGLKGHSQCFGTDYESSRDASH